MSQMRYQFSKVVLDLRPFKEIRVFFEIRLDFLQVFPTFLVCDDVFEVWGGFRNGFRSQERFEVSKVVSSLSPFRDIRALSGSCSGFFRGTPLFQVLLVF